MSLRYKLEERRHGAKGMKGEEGKVEKRTTGFSASSSRRCGGIKPTNTQWPTKPCRRVVKTAATTKGVKAKKGKRGARRIFH